MSLKAKKLTQEDIDLLCSEGWLTEKQRAEYENNFVGYSITRDQIETLCADYQVIDLIFQYKVVPTNITYHVNCLSHGLYKEGKADVFDNVDEAIKFQYKRAKEVPHMSWTIEVCYDEGVE